MALNRSTEFKSVIVQIVCVVEIQSESAWIMFAKPNSMHLRQASEASGFEEDFNIFLRISMVQPRTPWGRSILDPGATV